MEILEFYTEKVFAIKGGAVVRKDFFWSSVYFSVMPTIIRRLSIWDIVL